MEMALMALGYWSSITGLRNIFKTRQKQRAESRKSEKGTIKSSEEPTAEQERSTLGLSFLILSRAVESWSWAEISVYSLKLELAQRSAESREAMREAPEMRPLFIGSRSLAYCY